MAFASTVQVAPDAETTISPLSPSATPATAAACSAAVAIIRVSAPVPLQFSERSLIVAGWVAVSARARLAIDPALKATVRPADRSPIVAIPVPPVKV